MLALTTDAVLKGLWFLEDEFLFQNKNYANLLNHQPLLNLGVVAPAWDSA